MLTERQRFFAENYLSHAGNGTAAAIAAGYSRTTAAKRSSELLRHPDVAAIIEAQRGAIRSETDPVDVALELGDLYRACRAAGHSTALQRAGFKTPPAERVLERYRAGTNAERSIRAASETHRT